MRLVAVAAKASDGNLLIHPIHYVKISLLYRTQPDLPALLWLMQKAQPVSECAVSACCSWTGFLK